MWKFGLLLLATTCHAQFFNEIESALSSIFSHETQTAKSQTSSTTSSSTTCTKLPNCSSPKAKSGALKSQPNGCGSRLYGIDVPQFDFGSCCDNHDNCYSKCDTTFESCNNAFASCIASVCNQKSSLDKDTCQVEADVYAKAVQSDAACLAFRNNASDYCTC